MRLYEIIDVGDRCSRRFKLMTMFRCWLPILYIAKVTNILKLSPLYSHQHNIVIKIVVADSIDKTNCNIGGSGILSVHLGVRQCTI